MMALRGVTEDDGIGDEFDSGKKIAVNLTELNIDL